MKNYSKYDVVLVKYPFTEIPVSKIRPAVIVNTPHSSKDLIIVPLTSKIKSLREGEFALKEWPKAGLNVQSAVKRGLYTINHLLIKKRVGTLKFEDSKKLEDSLRLWLGITD